MRRPLCQFGWLRGVDLNHRPLGYEPNELPDCSTPRFDDNNRASERQTVRPPPAVISSRLLIRYQPALVSTGFAFRVDAHHLLGAAFMSGPQDSCVCIKRGLP